MNKQQVELFQAALLKRGNELTQTMTYDNAHYYQLQLRATILQDLHDVLEEYKSNLPETHDEKVLGAIVQMNEAKVRRERQLNTLQPDAEDLATARSQEEYNLRMKLLKEQINKQRYPNCNQCSEGPVEHFHCPGCGNRLSFKETQCCNCEYKL